jgi:hypothetical protein
VVHREKEPCLPPVRGAERPRCAFPNHPHQNGINGINGTTASRPDLEKQRRRARVESRPAAGDRPWWKGTIVNVNGKTIPPDRRRGKGEPPDCPQCGKAGVDYRWHEISDGRRQIRRSCARCYAWLGYAPQSPEFIALADAAASPNPILDALLKLDELGATLQSDGTRVWLGAESFRRVPPEVQDLIRQSGRTLAGMIGKTTNRTNHEEKPL